MICFLFSLGIRDAVFVAFSIASALSCAMKLSLSVNTLRDASYQLLPICEIKKLLRLWLSTESVAVESAKSIDSD